MKVSAFSMMSIAMAVALFASCATPPTENPSYVLDGIPIYGRAHDISRAGLRGAIAFDRGTPSHPENRIYSIDVVNRTELHVYHTPRNRQFQEYKIVKKVRGKWSCDERVVSGSSLLGY
jgi:hypothetical protein